MGSTYFKLKGGRNMKAFVTFIAVSVFSVSVLLGGWIIPYGVQRPASYEAIDRETVTEFETNMSNGPITYRSGHYTSLKDYSGEFTDILKPGSIILYKTNAGNYGKMMITGYAYYHAWSKVSSYKFCDVPFYVFTTFSEDGSILVSGGFPVILDGEVRVVGKTLLYGIGPLRNFFWMLDLRQADYPERPEGSCFMWFNFDFDTKQTGFFKNYNGVEFSGSDVYNEKSETKSRFFPSNGAIFRLIYKP